MEGVWQWALLGAFTLLLAAVLRSILSVRKNQGISGPKGWPYIGILPTLVKERETFHLKLQEWEKQYGKVFQFVVMGERWYAISDYSLISKILLARPASYVRWKKIPEVMNEMGCHGLFTAEGEPWTRFRKVTTPAFSSLKVADMEASFVLIVGRLMKKWDAASRDGQVVDAVADLLKFSLNAVALTAFGVDLNALEGSSQVQEDILFTFHVLARRFYSPFPWWRFKHLASDEDREYDKCRKRLDSLILELKQKAAESPQEQDGPDTLLKRLERSVKDESGESIKLTDEEFVGNVLTFFLAGQDTTAVTMAWTLFFLSTHPEIQAEVCAELDRVFGSESDVNPEALAAVNVKELKYLTMVIKEVLRLKPVLPWMGFQAIKTTEIREGLVVQPQDVLVLLNVAVALSDEHFERPLEFDPKRWEGDTRALGMAPGTAPFGSGQRICPGRFMALSEMQHCLAAICHRYVVSLAPDCPPESVTEISGSIMRPTQLRLSLARRRE